MVGCGHSSTDVSNRKSMIFSNTQHPRTYYTLLLTHIRAQIFVLNLRGTHTCDFRKFLYNFAH